MADESISIAGLPEVLVAGLERVATEQKRLLRDVLVSAVEHYVAEHDFRMLHEAARQRQGVASPDVRRLMEDFRRDREL